MTTKSPVKIGLIGSGKMGTDIFNYLAGFGFELAWLCETEPEAAEVRRKFIKKTERQFKNQLIDEQCYQRLCRQQLSDTRWNCFRVVNLLLKRSPRK